MDSSHLRTFLEIARRGSFTDAAAALDLSQPAVTFHVQRLERDLGTRLLDRGGGRVRLTTPGEIFLAHAERIVHVEEELRNDLARLRSDVRGTLRISASTVPGEFLVPGLLADFIAHYPDVRASMVVGDTRSTLEQVARGDAELGFTGAPSDRAGMIQVPFYRDTIVLIVPPGHPFAGRRSIRVEELQDQPIVTRESGSGTVATVRRLLEESGSSLKRWDQGVVLGSTQAVVSGVQAGLGVSFVSAFAVTNAVRAGTVAALSVEGVELARDLYLVYLEGGLSTRLLEEFAAFARTWGSTQQSEGT